MIHGLRFLRGLAACFAIVMIALPINQASAQQDIPFDCTSSQTFSHMLGVTDSIAQFQGDNCICGDTAEAAKDRIVALLRDNPGYVGGANVVLAAGGTSKRLEVTEGETARVTIYCYHLNVVESLLRGEQ